MVIVVGETSDANFNGGINVTEAFGVVIKNLTIQNGYTGIHLYDANNCRIENVVVTENSNRGIFLRGGSGNTVIEATALNNGRGIDLDNTTFNTVTNNVLTENEKEGIRAKESFGNTFSLNVLSHNGGSGVWFRENSNTNRLIENTIQFNTNGILVEESSQCWLICNTIRRNGRTDEGVPVEERAGDKQHGVVISGANYTLLDRKQHC